MASPSCNCLYSILYLHVTNVSLLNHLLPMSIHVNHLSNYASVCVEHSTFSHDLHIFCKNVANKGQHQLLWKGTVTAAVTINQFAKCCSPCLFQLARMCLWIDDILSSCIHFPLPIRILLFHLHFTSLSINLFSISQSLYCSSVPPRKVSSCF